MAIVGWTERLVGGACSGERDSALGMSRRWRAERSAREGTGKGEGWEREEE